MRKNYSSKKKISTPPPPPQHQFYIFLNVGNSSFSFSLVYLPIKAPTHEQNNLNNTNTTKHIYRVPVIIYNTSNTVFCVGDAMTHHEGQNNYYFPDHHNVP